MDVILEKFMEPERWRYAIGKAYDKDVKKSDLYQLTKPEIRYALYERIKTGNYEITPPHTALIPKDDGDFRKVYVNEPVDRVVLSICNDLLFELMPEMIHKNCKSYLRGIGCCDVVIELSDKVANAKPDASNQVGFKADLSKYFDSVPIRFIDEAFDKVEKKWGHSTLIDMLRKYYHCDWFFDTDGILKQAYQSLKQGCSVASWLADVVLCHIDVELSGMVGDGEYVRYSDDILYIGENYTLAMSALSKELEVMGMRLNPKKVEFIRPDMWFKFLGFSIKGANRSLSKTRIKTFQKEIKARTRHGVSKKKALNDVISYLYRGNGEYSWATQVLPVINVAEDIATLNAFVMDALRGAQTDRHKIGGLGFVKEQKTGCINRGKGANVKTNRERTEECIEGYMTLMCMKNAIMTSMGAFRMLVRML